MLWICVLGVLIILVVLLCRVRNPSNSAQRQPTTVAIIPLGVTDTGLIAAHLPDARPVVALRRGGYQSTTATTCKDHDLCLMDGVKRKTPVQLVRLDPQWEILQPPDGVKAITIDAGTRMITMHDEELQLDAGIPYQETYSGIRLGRLSIDFDSPHSSGTEGTYTVGKSRVSLRSALPSPNPTLGAKDFFRWGHRLIVNLRSKRALLQ